MKDSKTFNLETKQGTKITYKIERKWSETRGGYYWDETIIMHKDGKDFECKRYDNKRVTSRELAKYLGADINTTFNVRDTFQPVIDYKIQYTKKEGKKTHKVFAEYKRQQEIEAL